MRRSLAVGLLLFAALSTPAQAATPFEEFRRMCLQTSADLTKALAIADQDGWATVPQEMVDILTMRAKVRAGAPRAQARQSGTTYLFVGSVSEAVGAIHLNMCALIAPPDPQGRSSQDVANWAGVPANARLSRVNRASYVFSEDASGHIPVGELEGEAITSLAKVGRLKVVSYQQDKNGELLVLVAPVKEPS